MVKKVVREKKCMKKMVRCMRLLCLFLITGIPMEVNAQITEQKFTFPSDILRIKSVNIRLGDADKLCASLNKVVYKNGKLYDTTICFHEKKQGKVVEKIPYSKKNIVVDEVTTICIKKKIYQVTSKKKDIYLSVYNNKQKKLYTKRFCASSLCQPYKKVKVMELTRVSPKKFRVLYGNVNENGQGNSGGSVILNIKSEKLKKESDFSFIPQHSERGRAFGDTGLSIISAKLNSGKVESVWAKPKEKNINCALYDTFTCRKGNLLYVNSSGAYIAKRKSEMKKVYSFTKSKYATRYVRCAVMKNANTFYVGFGKEENVAPMAIIQYTI